MSTPFMPQRTRSSSKSEDNIDQLTSLIEEMKTSLVSELKSEIAKEVEKLVSFQKQLIEKLHSTAIENELTISVLKASVNALKTENDVLRNKYSVLDSKLNYLEQYGRRQNLCVEGIELKEKNEHEEPDEIVKKIHEMMVDVGVKAPIHVIDRAHRIGPVYDRLGDNKKCRSIIVKFNNFGFRTAFYRKRKQLKNDARIWIDLTKENYKFFKDSINFMNKKKWNDVYVFVDVNCRIKIVDTTRDEEAFVFCMDDVKNFLA